MRIFKSKFKEIYEASDGCKALELYGQYRPDMMVVDINLPYIDGLEVIENIREYDKKTPIVILSAYSDQDKLLRAIRLGLSEYLMKPVPHKKLLSLLDNIAMTNQTVIDEKNIILLQNGYFWKKKEKILCYGDERISLTKREIVFLEYMVLHVDEIIEFVSIENLLWENKESQTAYSAFSHFLKRLKKKLPEELIENIYGEGYRIISRH